jgi:oxygen-dependent protoporphyrinogen oxidase
VLHKGALRTLPDGLMFVVPTRVAPVFASPLLSPAGKLRLLLAPLLAPGPLAEGQDVSVERYITARFGREVAARIAEPLLNAVYGSDIDQLSTSAAFPQLLAMESQHGSLWKAFAKQVAGARAAHATQHATASTAGAATRSHTPSTLFVTLRDGLGQIPAHVAAALRTTRVLLGEQVESVERDAASGRYLVRSSGGDRTCDAVVMAAPAPVAARLLQPLEASVSECLGSIVYHSVAIAALGFRSAPPAPHAREWGSRGFGFVVPRGESRRTIACTWVHNKFNHRAPQGAALVRSFFGGARDEAVDQSSDADVLEAACRELGDIMGLAMSGDAAPDFHRVYRWPRCMPQYGVGHLAMIARLEARVAALPGLALAGNGFRGVGIPDCIDSARQAAGRVLDSLKL